MVYSGAHLSNDARSFELLGCISMANTVTREIGKAQRIPWHSFQESARAYFRASPLERIEIIKARIPASYVVTLTGSMEMSKETLYWTLHLARATIDRKIRRKERLTQDESERVLAVARLVGQADSMVQESGRPSGFDPAKWVSAWLQRPHPALGGRAPGELMDTADGRGLVADLLARQQSGAYA
jgi:putative toxin-antitoxin system antitoxin component (TIGR02293 family)